MNVSAHTIPGLYNAWGEGFFSTIRALNEANGRVFRTHASRSGDNGRDFIGDFASRDEAVAAVAAWAGI